MTVGDSWLKLLHATGAGASSKVDALLALPINGLSDEQVVDQLRQALAAKGLTPHEVLIANPAHLTTVRLFTLPSTDPKEIRDIVELQAEKHTPYAKEEILTDSLVIESNPAGYSRVLVAISHQEVVHRALRVAEAMNWTLKRVGLELEGLSAWFRAAQAGTSQGQILVAEIDSDLTATAVMQDGRLYYHRSLAVGSRHLVADPEQGPAKLVSELQRTLETFEAEGLNLKVSRSVLTGQAVRFPGLAVLVQQGLDLPTTIVPAQEGEAEVSFASLIGLSMAPTEIDLTPKTLRLQRTFEARSKELVKVGCQLIAGLLLLSCLVLGKAYESQKYQAWLMSQEQDALRQVGVLSTFTDQIRAVKEWQNSSDELLGAVVELYRLTPDNVKWSEVTFLRGQQLSLKGTAQETARVFDLVTELRKLPRFASVEAKKTTRKKEGDKDFTEFEVLCTFVPPAEVVG